MCGRAPVLRLPLSRIQREIVAAVDVSQVVWLRKRVGRAQFATKVAGYPSVFAHGMLTMGMTGRLVTDVVGGPDQLTKFGGRFTSQVWPGDTLTAVATVEEVRDEDGGPVVDLTVSTKNQDGVEVFAGYATARVEP